MNPANGAPTPLVAQFDGSSWTVVDQPWTQGSTTNTGFLTSVSAHAGDVWIGGVEDPQQRAAKGGRPLAFEQAGQLLELPALGQGEHTAFEWK